MFIYSPRKGTPAAKLEQDIPSEVISQRFKKLVELQTEIATELAKKFEGKTVEVLVDGPSKNNPEMLSGRTRSNRLVNFKAENVNKGEIVNVEIIRAGAFWLEGRGGKCLAKLTPMMQQYMEIKGQFTRTVCFSGWETF